MNGGHLLSPFGRGQLEGELRDPRRSFFRDNLQALNDPWDDNVLDPGVQILRVLPDHDEVHLRVTALDARQALHRSDIRVEVQGLAQLDVGTAKTLPYWSRERPLQRD